MTGVRTLFALAAGDQAAALPGDAEQTAIDLLGPRRSLFLRLVPRITRTLARAGALESIPDRLAADLHRLSQSLVAHDLHQQQWLRRFLTERRPGDIPVILLKGTAFSGALYPSDAPRLSQDIDLLVKPEQFHRMCEILAAEGEPLKVDTGRRYTWSRLFEAVFRIPGALPLLVEVHRDLTRAHQFRIDRHGLWERSDQSPEYQDPAVRQLSPEDTLLHLAVHEFRHGVPQPHSYLDAWSVLNRWTPDLGRVVQLARRWGCSTILYSLLRRVAFLFEPEGFEPGGSLRDDLDGVLQALEPSGIKKAVLDRLFPCNCFEPVRHTWPWPRRTASLLLLDHTSRILRFAFSYLAHRSADLALLLSDRISGTITGR